MDDGFTPKVVPANDVRVTNVPNRRWDPSQTCMFDPNVTAFIVTEDDPALGLKELDVLLVESRVLIMGDPLYITHDGQVTRDPLTTGVAGTVRLLLRAMGVSPEQTAMDSAEDLTEDDI